MQEEEDNNAEKQYCPYMGLAALLFKKCELFGHKMVPMINVFLQHKKWIIK